MATLEEFLKPEDAKKLRELGDKPKDKNDTDQMIEDAKKRNREKLKKISNKTVKKVAEKGWVKKHRAMMEEEEKQNQTPREKPTKREYEPSEEYLKYQEEKQKTNKETTKEATNKLISGMIEHSKENNYGNKTKKQKETWTEEDEKTLEEIMSAINKLSEKMSARKEEIQKLKEELRKLEAEEEKNEKEETSSTQKEKNIDELMHTKIEIKDRLDAMYLKGKKGDRFSRTENTGENSFFRIFDISGDKAKFEYFGNDEEAIAERIFGDDKVIELMGGNMINGEFVNNVEPGELKRDGDEWIVIKKVKVVLGSNKYEKNSEEELTPTEDAGFARPDYKKATDIKYKEIKK